MALFYLWGPYPLAAASRIVVTIPDVVRVEGSACSLAEIADISASKEAREILGGLLLSVEGGSIFRDRVVEALNVSGLDGVSVELRMPPEVRVAEPGASGAPERPRGATKEDEARLLSVIKSLTVWDGGVEATLSGPLPKGRVVAPASVSPGTSAVTLRFRDDAGKERTVGVRLMWTQNVLVAARSLKKDQPLSASDFEVRSQRILRPDVYVSELSQVEGLSLKKDLRQGQPLTRALLSLVPVARVGKTVTILARGPGVLVSAKGVVMTAGAVGDEVKVRRADNRAVLTAVVRDENTVEVNIP